MAVRLITPFLWFDHQAEEAVAFYTAVFPHSRVLKTARYGEGAPRPAGSIMTVEFELDGQPFIALNGGPHYQFSEAVSFVITCATQAEIDHYWDKLSDGGTPLQCGWLKDKFGLTWQVVPAVLATLAADPNRQKSSKAMQAMLGMVKLDVAELQRAFDSG